MIWQSSYLEIAEYDLVGNATHEESQRQAYCAPHFSLLSAGVDVATINQSLQSIFTHSSSSTLNSNTLQDFLQMHPNVHPTSGDEKKCTFYPTMLLVHDIIIYLSKT